MDALHVGLVTPLSVIGVAVSVDYHIAVTSFSSGNNSYGWCCRHNVKQKCFGLSMTVVRPILCGKYSRTIDIIFLGVLLLFLHVSTLRKRFEGTMILMCQ